ncbi:isochorismatase family protein [Sulfurospirillum sp. 1307]|jgi:nicotinamidase-related amidase
MRIEANNTQALLVDIQKKLFPHMYEKELFLEKTLKLVQGLQLLEIPVLLNEQYKKGLGETIEPIREILLDKNSFEKTTFSCCKNNSTLEEIKKRDKKFVIVFGIETHVCVLQTILDLKEEGFIPILVEDATTSRNPNDKKIAIQRIISEGSVVTTYESLLFELCVSSKNKAFKEISKLVK